MEEPDLPDQPAERLEGVDDADVVVVAQVVDALCEQPVQVRPRAAGVGGEGLCANLKIILSSCSYMVYSTALFIQDNVANVLLRLLLKSCEVLRG